MSVDLSHPLALALRGRSDDGPHPLARADLGAGFDFGDTYYLPHISISIGAPRSGKSEEAIQQARAAAAAENCAIVLLSPQPYDTAWKAGGTLFGDGHGHRIVFDSMGWTDRVLSVNCRRRSRFANPVQAALDDEISRAAFVEQVLRRRDTTPESHPLILEGLMLADMGWCAQRGNVPPSWMYGVINPFDARHSKLVEFCTSWEIRERMRSIPHNWQVVRREFGPALRALEQSVCDPILRMREGDGKFDFYEFLLANGIWIVEGCPSRTTVRTYFGGIINQLLQCMREHFAATGQPLNVTLIIDEVSNYDLIGSFESRAFLEMIKMGLRVIVISHDGFFFDEQTTKRVWQSALVKKFFYCSDAAIAEFCGLQMISRLYDPEAVGWIEKRRRQVHGGFQEIPYEETSESRGSSWDPEHESSRENTSTSVRKGVRFQPIYHDEIDEIPHMLDRSGQIGLIVKELTNPNIMLPGVYWELSRTIQKWRANKLDDPCAFPGILEDEFNMFLTELKRSDIYQDAAIGLITENATMRLSNGSGPGTRQRSGKSSEQGRSPLSRLRGVRPNGSPKQNGSK